ncbi:MAG: hypothetical protein AAF572_16935 [Cyanobacteria bacterium P01_B01_bin.77]
MPRIDNLPDNLADCRYCSQASKANGVDFILIYCNYWLDHWTRDVTGAKVELVYKVILSELGCTS